MKKLLLGTMLLLIAFITKAQGPVAVGQIQFNAGLGFSSSGIPIYAGIDYGIHKDITIGGEVNFRHYNDHWNGNSYGHNGIGILANGNYHFNSLLKMPPEWNFYAGGNVGFYFWSSPDNYGGSTSSGLGLGGQVGGRYYFNEKFGLNLEVGGGTGSTGGKFGISLRL